MAQLFGYTKTKKIKLVTDKSLDGLMHTTTEQYRTVFRFYEGVFQTNWDTISSVPWLVAAETLTHRTKNNPSPTYPLDEIASKYPSGFRRCAISSAFGQTKSTKTRYDKWQTKKAKHEEKNKQREAEGKKSIPFTDHPPQWGKESNVWLSYYDTEWKILDFHHVLLKFFNGKTYEKRKIALQEPLMVPHGYELGSPALVFKKDHWELHVPFVLLYKNNKIGTVKERVSQPHFRICTVDLGLKHHAVLTIQEADGRVVKVKFISAKEDNHRRKLLLSKISSKQKITKVIPEEESFAQDLWEKVRHFNDAVAHRVSKEIVDFAKEYGANTIVFEHLQNLQPSRARFSIRMNQKMMYWMKGKIVKYTKYKAPHEQMMVNRVSPKNTSRRCIYCGFLSMIRYTESPKKWFGVELAHCIRCKAHALNADFVGSVGVGTNFRLKYVN